MLSVLDQQWKDHLLSHGPPARRHRAARLWPARSAGGVQARVVRHVRSHDGALRGRDRSLPVPHAGDRSAGRRAALYSSGWTDGRRNRGRACRCRQRGGNGSLRGDRPAATSMDDMEEAFQRRKRRELEQARMAGAAKPARCSRWFAETRSAATILVPAAAARNTRSAAERRRPALRCSLLAYSPGLECGPSGPR